MARTPKPLPSIDWLKPRLTFSRSLSLFSFLALASLVAVWNLIFADLHGARPWVVLSIQMLPLLLLVPGMLRGNARTHTWACFIVNIYFIQGVLAATDPNRQLFGWLSTLLSFSLFCSALLYARWRFQYERRLAGES